MSKAIENLQAAYQQAVTGRPKVGGFPYFIETLSRAGITHNICSLPSCQSIFITKHGNVVMPGIPLLTDVADVPVFNRDALLEALRTDYSGKSRFSEFLHAVWNAGVIRYDVDFIGRTAAFYGAGNERYVESYPSVEL